ncbi:MAG: tetratricopeptide repeat protein [Elusimicrobiota bacterium]
MNSKIIIGFIILFLGIILKRFTSKGVDPITDRQNLWATPIIFVKYPLLKIFVIFLWRLCILGGIIILSLSNLNIILKAFVLFVGLWLFLPKFISLPIIIVIIFIYIFKIYSKKDFTITPKDYVIDTKKEKASTINKVNLFLKEFPNEISKELLNRLTAEELNYLVDLSKKYDLDKNFLNFKNEPDTDFALSCFATTLTSFANAMGYSGQTDLAIESLKLALKIYPQDIATMTSLAIGYHLKKDNSEALRYIDIAITTYNRIKSKPKNQLTTYEQGILLSETKLGKEIVKSAGYPNEMSVLDNIKQIKKMIEEKK